MAGAAIGLALSMDPAVASRLSPASLKSLLELSDVNREVIALVAAGFVPFLAFVVERWMTRRITGGRQVIAADGTAPTSDRA